MSKSKTCGECRYRYAYPHDEDRDGRCELFEMYRVPSNKRACSKFKPIPPPTLGDKIRQMNNTDLAEMLVYPVKPMNIDGNIHYEFTSCLLLGKSYPMREQAVYLTEKMLNAPAGKDNNVPAKESEVHNGFSKCAYCGKPYRKKKKHIGFAPSNARINGGIVKGLRIANICIRSVKIILMESVENENEQL